MEERLAVIAETKEELTNALNDFLSGKETGQNFFTGRNKAMKQLFTEMTDNAEMSGTVDQWIEADEQICNACKIMGARFTCRLE